MRTIFAPATPPGRSGVAVLRISGPKAHDCLRAFSVTTKLQPRLATLQSLKHPTKHHIIDKVLLLWFKAPHSFTGEDTLEIHHHGSIAVRNDLLDALSHIEGFFLAEAGEFARQAFHNNKMDISEIEGLADLIESETLIQKQQALTQMEGSLNHRCSQIRQDIIRAKAYLEAFLDFPDEDIPPSTYETINTEVESIIKQLREIISNAKYGEKIREGFTGIILGEPNAGKSTLLNALVKRDAAIVSEIAGTTRDLIEAHLDIDGLPVTLIDTAGIRECPDIIEEEGIKRALQKAQDADFILHLMTSIDDTLPTINISSTAPIVRILSKTDTLPQDIVFHVKHKFDVLLSVKDNTGLVELTSTIKHLLLDKNQSSPLITRERHRIAFDNALNCLESYLTETDLLIKAEELHLAMNHIATITGTIYLDEIYDLLFSSFCIGK